MNNTEIISYIADKTGVTEDRLMMVTVFGSQLYGTDNEESDTDYKGIYIPTKEELFLGTAKKAITTKTKKGEGRNTRDDVDVDLYSLPYFMKMACDGDTSAMDMLHAPESMLVHRSSAWESIVRERSKFYTKSLKAFVGYARKQASKYGIKGSRLSDAENVLSYLGYIKEDYGYNVPLHRVWDDLPEGEHTHKYPASEKHNGNRLYEVCGRKFGEKVKIGYAYEGILKFYNAYGYRARQAKDNKGVDWKAVSHALRAAYQMVEVYTVGTITFPLNDRDFIREVKEGKHDYTTVVAPKLETIIEEVEKLSNESEYPEETDRKYWDKHTIRLMEAYL